MKKLYLIVTTMLLSVALLSFFNPVIGISSSLAIALALGSIAVPFAKFAVSLLWNAAIQPLYANVDSGLGKKALRIIFAPPSK